MKKIVFLLMAIVVMLSIVPVSWTAVYADDGISLARKSGQNYIDEISASLDSFSQWKEGELTYIRKVLNSQNQEIGYIFLI